MSCSQGAKTESVRVSSCQVSSNVLRVVLWRESYKLKYKYTLTGEMPPKQFIASDFIDIRLQAKAFKNHPVIVGSKTLAIRFKEMGKNWVYPVSVSDFLFFSAPCQHHAAWLTSVPSEYWLVDMKSPEKIIRIAFSRSEYQGQTPDNTSIFLCESNEAWRISAYDFKKEKYISDQSSIICNSNINSIACSMQNIRAVCDSSGTRISLINIVTGTSIGDMILAGNEVFKDALHIRGRTFAVSDITFMKIIVRDVDQKAIVGEIDLEAFGFSTPQWACDKDNSIIWIVEYYPTNYAHGMKGTLKGICWDYIAGRTEAFAIILDLSDENAAFTFDPKKEAK